jgi:hypothetical protein
VSFVEAECRAVSREVVEKGAGYPLRGVAETVFKVTTRIKPGVEAQCRYSRKGQDGSARAEIKSGLVEAMILYISPLEASWELPPSAALESIYMARISH